MIDGKMNIVEEAKAELHRQVVKYYLEIENGGGFGNHTLLLKIRNKFHISESTARHILMSDSQSSPRFGINNAPFGGYPRRKEADNGGA